MSNYYKELLNKIEAKQATIVIYGLGYVGLPLALTCVKKGFSVYGIDLDEQKIQFLEDRKSYIKHIPNSEIIKYYRTESINTYFKASIDPKFGKDCDIHIICVPTPLKNNEPDLQYVKDAAYYISYNYKKGSMISLESTVYPGATKDIIYEFLENELYHVEDNYFIVYSPEREDPGNKKYNISNIPKVVGGYDKKSLEIGKAFYSSITEKIHPVESLELAEMSKLYENTYRAINISFVNEMKIICDKLRIDIWDVIKASSTKPFGFTPFYPSSKTSGHCICDDPYYLSWKCRQIGKIAHFIELSGEINASMPLYVISKIQDAINSKGKSIKGSDIIIIGVAYKKNIEDTRESGALDIIKDLEEKGGKISYYDTYVQNIEVNNKYYNSIDLSEEKLKEADCIVVITAHDNIDYDFIFKNSNLIVDTQNVFKKDEKVWKA